MLSRPDCFTLYGTLGVASFSIYKLLYANIRFGLSLIRARPNFYRIRDNPNVTLGIDDSSLYTSRIARKDDYHTKR